ERVGRLVDRQQNKQALSTMFSNIRQRLLAFPSKLAPRVVSCRRAAEVQELVRVEIYALISVFQQAMLEIAEGLKGKTGGGNGHADPEIRGRRVNRPVFRSYNLR